jgi:hypothetical protein
MSISVVYRSGSLDGRHCEPRRSNPPVCDWLWIASSLALLAMTKSEIPNVIPTALRQRAIARFCLHRAAAAVSSLSDRSRLAPPDEKDRQGQIGLVLKPLPAWHRKLI